MEDVLKPREGARRKLKIDNSYKYQPEFQANCLSLMLSGAHPSQFQRQYPSSKQADTDIYIYKLPFVSGEPVVCLNYMLHI
jgi:hypothetical protein